MLAAGNSTETAIDCGEHKITPLLKAAWDGDAEIVSVLLEAGAKVNAKATDTGETALMNAVSQDNAYTQAVAARKQDLAELLLKAAAKIEDGASGLTPLQFAASAGDVERDDPLPREARRRCESRAALRNLWRATRSRADAHRAQGGVNAKTKDGTTPLKAAMKGDQDDIIPAQSRRSEAVKRAALLLARFAFPLAAATGGKRRLKEVGLSFRAAARNPGGRFPRPSQFA